MKAIQIKTEPFYFLSIQKLSIRRKVNQHSVLLIEGLIEEKLETEYFNQCIGEKNIVFQVRTKEEQNELLYFSGMITNFKLQKEGNGCTLLLEVTSTSYLMDLKQHLRFYQNESQSVKGIVEEICSTYPSCSFLMDIVQDDSLKQFTIQYLESDWQFLKRLASRYHQMLIPMDHIQGLNFCVGVTNQSSYEVQEEHYICMNEIQDYYRISNEMESHPLDCVSYQFTSREIFFLGDMILFRQHELHVYEIHSELLHGELVHHYKLKAKSGFRVPHYRNHSVIGASFQGEIAEIEKDNVRIKLYDGENKNQTPSKRFPFSTVYSSPDGTGWYCMPEQGDTVRLYVPSEKEEDAYVISSVHETSADSNARVNPDRKSLKTKYGKEVYFTPNSIVMTNHKGNTVTLQDDYGIKIESSKDIVIEAVGDISLRSVEETMLLNASDKINICQGGTQLVVDDDIAFQGGKLRME